MYTDVMVDLETWGKRTDAVVLSIGAFAFNPHGSDDLTYPPTYGWKRTFHVALDTQSQIDAGRTVCSDTLKWWLTNNATVPATTNQVRRALVEFNQWIKENCDVTQDVYLWGNGSTFDVGILKSLYETFGMRDDWPFGHWQEMDLRTFRRFNERKEARPWPEKLTKHNALHDALYQTMLVQDALTRRTAEAIPVGKLVAVNNDGTSIVEVA